MSIFVKGGRAAKALSRIGRKTIVPASIIATGATVGAFQAERDAQAGLKFPAIKEGLLFGATIGVGLALSPKLARIAKKSGMARARKASRKGNIIFRKIRGRIVPVGRKK